MKILVAVSDLSSTSNDFAEELLHTFNSAGFDTALSSCKAPEARAAYYPCPRPSAPLFNFHADNRTIEEYMYSAGLLSEKYTKDDLASLQEAINAFSPELIIALNRPAALCAAELNSLPCWVIVHPAMYRGFWFPSHCLKGFNAVCSSYKLEQQLSLSSFYAKADRRIGFGPLSFSPFMSSDSVSRLGFMCEASHPSPAQDTIVFMPGEISRSDHYLKKLILSAFQGSSAKVIVTDWKEDDIYDNIRFRKGFRPSDLDHASVLIHDGSSYMVSLAIAHNIPQIIISDHTCFRSFNAVSLQRTKAGIFLYEEDLTMASLYEAYRTILSDDAYRTGTEALRKESERRGSIKELVDLTYIDLISR
jgi:hypothetical protein